MVLNLTIMNFGNVFLTKVIHLNSPLGTKVSILGNPIRHISNLYQFYYMVPRVLIPIQGGEYVRVHLFNMSLC